VRILHIITGLTLAGAEGVLFRLCASPGSGTALHAVIALSSDGAHYIEPLRQAGIPVQSLAMPRGRLTLSGLIALFRTIRKMRPDIVQTWLYHADLVGGAVARLAGQHRVAWNLRSAAVAPHQVSRSTRWVIRACAALSPLVPARVICCSEEARAAHVGLGYAADRMTVIPNGFCCETFAPDADKRAAVRRELALAADAIVLGMVARYHPQKDHANLLDALALLAGQHPELTCVLVGTGIEPANAELAAAVTTRGLAGKVRLLGPRHDIPAAMNALDLHVLSSACLEGFPNVVAEAMACGTPCVATDVGEARGIVGATGWIVPPSDSRALAQAIAAALAERRNDPAAWRARQQAARTRIADNFSLHRMVESYEAAWSQMLATGEPPPCAD
jgi:glycosyltransferase involved in cell wall biosynthesis